MNGVERKNRAFRLFLVLVVVAAAAGVVAPCWIGRIDRRLTLAARETRAGAQATEAAEVTEEEAIDITALWSLPAASDASVATPATAILRGASGERSRSVTRLLRVTAYCPCPICCGKWADGRTSSGRPVSFNAGRFVAADASLPFGALIRVPGYHGGRAVPVLDRMRKCETAAYRGRRVDVFFPTHAQAKVWGVRWLKVEILPFEPAAR